MTTADNTDTQTKEATSNELGTGGIASAPTVGNLDQLVNVIVDKRESLLNTNQRNVEVFNELQRVGAKIANSLSILDGAIAGISEFITEETSEDDAHIVRLRELQENKTAAIQELKLANSKRTLLITSIQATEISLGLLNSILERAGSENIRKTDLSTLVTQEQAQEKVSEDS